MEGNDLHNVNGNERYEELLARWLSGDLTPEELAELEASEGKEELEKLQQVMEASSQMAPPPFDRKSSWERLAAEAGLEEETVSGDEPEVVPFDNRESVAGSGPEKKSRFGLYGIGLAVAAGLALLLVFVILPGGNGQMKEYFADGGQAIQVNLPDGSQIELNAGSKLSYDEDNFAENREVSLSGEAFFKVAKASNKSNGTDGNSASDGTGASGKQPFRVTTEGGYVDVLGTRFNVQAAKDKLLVGCFSGKVKVSDTEEKEIVVIAQGEYVGLEAGKVQRNRVAGEVPGWAEKEFTYDGTDLTEVIKVMEQEFDIEITCQDCKGLPFSGKISNTDLRGSLDLVSLPNGKRWTETDLRTFVIK